MSSALTVDDSEVFIVQAPEDNVYFIYPDTATNSKPLGCSAASPIDWTATGFVNGLTRHTQLEGLDTNSALIDQSTGAPTFSDMSIFLSGGCLVQVPVRYYEDNRIAPVYFGIEDEKCYWFKKDGARIDATGLNPSSHQDMFVIEHFLDQKGNTVLIIYGYGGYGTFAGAKLFKEVIHPNIRDYTHSYYIYLWIDNNNDFFPDLDEININPVAFGD